MLLLRVLITLAALWHTLAFAAGGAFVCLAYAALFGLKYERWWTRIIRSADLQLWLSGLALIALGVAASGFQTYASNPKLWAKLMVITVWPLSTQVMRAAKMAGRSRTMLAACGVNLACWIYGAFLGVAKPLAFGVVPFWGFVLGFAGLCLITVITTLVFQRRRLSCTLRPAPFQPLAKEG